MSIWYRVVEDHDDERHEVQVTHAGGVVWWMAETCAENYCDNGDSETYERFPLTFELFLDNDPETAPAGTFEVDLEWSPNFYATLEKTP